MCLLINNNYNNLNQQLALESYGEADRSNESEIRTTSSAQKANNRHDYGYNDLQSVTN